MPSSKNYVRNYKQEAATETPKRKKQRDERVIARRMLEKEGKVHVGDGKDVGHRQALGRGGKNVLSNLFVQDPQANRSFKRNAKGKMVSEISTKERKGKMR